MVSGRVNHNKYENKMAGDLRLVLGIFRRRTEVGFNGGNITGDAGLLLFRQVDRKPGLLANIARMFSDDCDPEQYRK